MLVNVVNSDEVKSYAQTLAREEGDFALTPSNLKDFSFIKKNQDSVVRAIMAQFIKKRLADYLQSVAYVPYLTPVTSAQEIPA